MRRFQRVSVDEPDKKTTTDIHMNSKNTMKNFMQQLLHKKQLTNQ